MRKKRIKKTHITKPSQWILFIGYFLWTNVCVASSFQQEIIEKFCGFFSCAQRPPLLSFKNRVSAKIYLENLSQEVEEKKRTEEIISYLPSFTNFCPAYMEYLICVLAHRSVSKEEITHLLKNMPLQENTLQAHHDGCLLMAEELATHLQEKKPDSKAVHHPKTPLSCPDAVRPVYDEKGIVELPDSKEIYKRLKYIQGVDFILKMTGKRSAHLPLFSEKNYTILWEKFLELENKTMTYKEFTLHLSHAHHEQYNHLVETVPDCDLSPLQKEGLEEATLTLATHFMPEIYLEFLVVTRVMENDTSESDDRKSIPI